MTNLPVLLLVLVDLAIFAVAAFVWDPSPQKKENLLLSSLFLCSGIPALIYQVVWQRSLFGIYGVNAESVAVVVSAFMTGLGVGSLLGGWLSSRFPRQSILFFGLAELGTAIFGLSSLKIFHWAATFSAGAGLLSVAVFSVALLVIPTLLMGATLPLLVEHLVAHSGRVGLSVSRLYFANTLGSAIACYLCATFLLRDFGQTGSVTIAACLNTLVGACAFLYGRRAQHEREGPMYEARSEQPASEAPISLNKSMALAALSGFLALGFEIVWFRVFALASGDRAPAFALLLATYLGGIAAGSYLTEMLTEGANSSSILRCMGVLLLLAGGLSPFLPPLVAELVHRNVNYLWSAPAFFLVAGFTGCVLPLLCQLSIRANVRTGRQVSLIYACNIAGSVLGSLGIGFVWMQHYGLRSIAAQLALVGIAAGAIVLLLLGPRKFVQPTWTWMIFAVAIAAVPLAWTSYNLIFEKLTFGARAESGMPFAHVVENRNGVVAVTGDGAVFGGGVYDGYFRIDPTDDANLVVRAFAILALHPAPKRELTIGLASGSWAQALINDSRVTHFDAVEINPGYLGLIPQYAVVQSFLQNPKLHLYVDDGRRWLLAHPQEKYDVIITNTTYHWRDHSTTLLSREYYQLIRQHLNPGGVYYFNSTESEETMATALTVFPYGLRVINFLAVSDSPIVFDGANWLRILSNYRIDGRAVFDPQDPRIPPVLAAYAALADTVHQPPRFLGLETADSLSRRIGKQRIITDENMGREWEPGVLLPWREKQ